MKKFIISCLVNLQGRFLHNFTTIYIQQDTPSIILSLRRSLPVTYRAFQFNQPVCLARRVMNMNQYIHHVEIASVVNINHLEKHLLQMIMVYIEQLSVKDVKQVEVCLDFYEVFFFFFVYLFFQVALLF